MNWSLNTVLTLIIVGSLQAVLVVQQAHERGVSAGTIVLLSVLHLAILGVTRYVATLSSSPHIAGWRLSIVAGVVLLAPQTASKWLIEDRCVLYGENFALAFLLWFVAAGIAVRSTYNFGYVGTFVCTAVICMLVLLIAFAASAFIGALTGCDASARCMLNAPACPSRC